MKLISEGKTTDEISKILTLSVHTVNNHRKNITSKLEAKNITELISHFNDWKESEY
jgi:DNA-binding CsgD family transcriptional regulator